MYASMGGTLTSLKFNNRIALSLAGKGLISREIRFVFLTKNTY